jgi:hypothetical protein
MSRDPRDAEMNLMLNEAGTRWRAEQSDPPPVVLPRSSPRPTFLVATGTLAAAVGTSLLLIGVMVTRSMPETPLQTNAAVGVQATVAPAVSSSVVRDGDLVYAMGRILLASDSSVPVLCRFGLQLLPDIPNKAPTCSSVRVELSGLSATPSLPGWHRAGGGTWMSSDVKVVGSWEAGQLKVDGVISSGPASMFPDMPSDVPCEAPASGWPGNGNLDTMEAATAKLDVEVSSHPAIYSGYWWGTFGGVSRDQGATVVGTVGNAATVRSALEDIYPFNLCVVQVARSRADLDALASAISAQGESLGWAASVSAPLDKVVVHVPALTEQADQLLSEYSGALRVDPLVVRR